MSDVSYLLTWDEVGERTYETGVKMGVLYNIDAQNAYSSGVAWNGLTKVSEKPTGGEATDLYADDTKYLSMLSLEKFEASIEAYTYPPEFEKCDGSATLSTGVIIGQQTRETFGLCYRTTLGNDVKGNDYGYKLHLVYNCTCSPSERAYETINDSPDAITFSWEFDSTPVNVNVGGAKPTSVVTVDSTKATSSGLTALENALYGTENTDPYLPDPETVATLLATT